MSNEAIKKELKKLFKLNEPKKTKQNPYPWRDPWYDEQSDDIFEEVIPKKLNTDKPNYLKRIEVGE